MTAQAAKVQASATEKLWNEQLGVFMASTGEPIVAGVFGCKHSLGSSENRADRA